MSLFASGKPFKEQVVHPAGPALREGGLTHNVQTRVEQTVRSYLDAAHYFDLDQLLTAVTRAGEFLQPLHTWVAMPKSHVLNRASPRKAGRL